MGLAARLFQSYGGIPGKGAVKLDSALREIYNVKMNDAADQTGGSSEVQVGFQVQDWKNENASGRFYFQLASFADNSGRPNIGLPLASGILSTPTQGAILDGSGTEAIILETNTSGYFQCKLTDLIDETVWLVAAPAFGSPVVDCRSVDSVTFSA